MQTKIRTKGFLCVVLLFIFSVSILYAQEPGYELYQKLMTERRNLISYEGDRSVRWTPEGDAFIIDKDQSFYKVDPETGDETSLFDDKAIISAYNEVTGEETDRLPFTSFTFIENGKKIRFYREQRTKVFFYNRYDKSLKMFKVEPPFTGVRGASYEEVFSPDYKYTVYVDDYNLYLRDIEADKTTPLTTDGHEDLRNGFPDWVYAEEFAQFHCYWWSPDSKKLAYMQFDESPVRKFPVLHDENYDFDLEMQSFPRVGENNPIIRFFIIDIETKDRVQVDTGIETNVYLLNGRWSHDSKTFTLKRLNRMQNKVEILAADPETGASRVLFKESEPTFITEGIGFMNEGNEIYFLPDNKHFLRTSERSGWREIYLYDISGKFVRQITKAQLPVQAIQTYDPEKEMIYFTGYENRGLETHLYRVNLKGKGLKRLTAKAGSHNVSVAPGGKYFSDSYSSYSEPATFSIYTGEGKLIKTMGKTLITNEFEALKLEQPEPFTFKSGDGKYDLDGILYKPAGFDPGKKYPVLYMVYCGPSTKAMSNRYYGGDYQNALAQLGFMIVNIDNRGLLRRGKEFESASYGKLGQTDVEDLKASIIELSKRPYIDAERVGITGGSYGGYISLMMLLKAPEHFHVAVANSPGVDWRNYDTIYTERYMGLPIYNKDGYEKGNPLNYTDNLRGKLLIQHGAVDDNVHPTHVMQVVYKLLQAGKEFDWFMYPGMAHGIRFRQAQTKMMNWFMKYLQPETMDDYFADQD